MPILVVGANYRSCPIEVRERLAFRTEQLASAYAALRDHVGLTESLILSTCNRVEIYAKTSGPDGAAGKLASFLSAHSRLGEEMLHPQLYVYTEPSSIRHLFRVASGLDSMVLGETEILHQVKRAYEQAQQHGTTGKALNVLFQKALNAGKAVRAQTAISAGCLSVGTVAIEFAQKIFGDLAPYTVLLAGAGKIGEMVLQRLTERGVSRVRILNRTLERAQAMAARYGGQAAGLDQLAAQLCEADIAITSMSSPNVILSRAVVEQIMAARRHRPLCLIDLGVPRNIELDAGELENVYLFDVDDLQGLIDHNHQRRQQALQAAQAILEQKPLPNPTGAGPA
jgi:glutamyl-tRNA reductase